MNVLFEKLVLNFLHGSTHNLVAVAKEEGPTEIGKRREVANL